MLAAFIGSAVATVVIVMMWAARLQKEVNAKGGCPNCGMPVPMFRNPTSLHQAIHGGWTCSSCGTDMDRNGMELSQASRR